MKSYLSISKEVRQDLYVYCFDKIDGSNIRAEWNAKKGFYKFGSRTQLIDENTKTFGESISIIKQKYENDLELVFKEQKWRDVVCFFEFYGPNSFAGTHQETDQKTVTLFDVNIYKQGMLPPKDFIKIFGHLDIPKVLYEGKINTTLFDKVKQSTLSGMTHEGVVAKGVDKGHTVMFKIKSQAWLDNLRKLCGDNQNLFNKLS